MGSTKCCCARIRAIFACASGVGADAEGEGEDGDGGEAGGFAQHAQAVAQILHEILNPVYAACIAAFHTKLITL